eukprot:TRINITY_DN6363_c0_g1_i2.p1 TRINITY_DN6363_c0_g1~~TRINITY_DN6363_c0_g1_i2.p1  ORF type:complete len:321 (+),score=44.55 TRINITY_DN6363_c0_g1_i2:71-964(+)
MQATVQACHVAEHVEQSRSQDPLPRCEGEFLEFEATIVRHRRGGHQSTGLVVSFRPDSHAVVTAVMAEGLVADWNRTEMSDHKVRPGDELVETNGVGSSNKNTVLALLRKSHVMTLKFRRRLTHTSPDPSSTQSGEAAPLQSKRLAGASLRLSQEFFGEIGPPEVPAWAPPSMHSSTTEHGEVAFAPPVRVQADVADTEAAEEVEQLIKEAAEEFMSSEGLGQPYETTDFFSARQREAEGEMCSRDDPPRALIPEEFDDTGRDANSSKVKVCCERPDGGLHCRRWPGILFQPCFVGQ